MIRLAFSAGLIVAFTVGLILPLAAQQPQDLALKAQVLASPPPAVLDLAQRVSPPDHIVPIDVTFVHADLDGSASFSFIVALFFTAEGSQSGFLRVFKQNGPTLTVVGDQDDADPNGGGLASIELVDVNGDGIPEIEVSGAGYSGKISSFALYSWTSSSLHLMTASVDTVNAFLEDIDGDGKLELIEISVPVLDPAEEELGIDPNLLGYTIYKLQGKDFEFLADAASDPTGTFDASGNIGLVNFKASIKPPRFTIEQIRRALARTDDEHEPILVTLKRLRDPAGSRVSTDQIDLATLVMDRSLTPLRTILKPAESEQDNDKSEEDTDEFVVRAEFSREAVLRLLPRLQLTKPLAPGDRISINLHAKLKDGRTADGAVVVKIVASEGDLD